MASEPSPAEVERGLDEVGPLRVLVVCTANVCRSPVAARLLAQGMASIGPDLVVVTSAGVSARPGAPRCDQAGGPGEGHPEGGARLLSEGDLAGVDLVLVAERAHLGAVGRLRPAVRSRTFTLRHAARIADAVGARLHGRERPEGAPALPAASAPTSRLRWWVGELDAARGTVPGTSAVPPERGCMWGPDDVPDPHVLGPDLHPVADELVRDAVTRLVASAVASVSSTMPHDHRVGL